jgi:hypothetical protein
MRGGHRHAYAYERVGSGEQGLAVRNCLPLAGPLIKSEAVTGAHRLLHDAGQTPAIPSSGLVWSPGKRGAPWSRTSQQYQGRGSGEQDKQSQDMRSMTSNLYVSCQITGAMVGRQPFGGSRLSGSGAKVGGPGYLLEFVEGRVVSENVPQHGLVV